MKKIFNFIILIVTLFIYASVYIPPDWFWPAGFISYLIPLAILFNLVLLALRISKLKPDTIYPLLALIIGFYFLRNSFSISKNYPDGNIKVLTYNTKVFNVYKNDGKDTVSVNRMIEWINRQDADILCFQEFYNNSGSEHFNTIQKINHLNQYQVFNNSLIHNRSGDQFGVAIFSKYPMVHKGVLQFDEKNPNMVIYGDFLIGQDTVRVYNMHLQSMHINEDEMINAKDYQAEFGNLAERLRFGYMRRAEQIRLLKTHMNDCNYPIFLCGDLNDLPYSYAYRELNEFLHNGFTKAGNGFGFTFNGKLFFLRIDNQFFDNRLKIHSFNTHREIKESDHFPVTATYSIKKD